ncbi:MAG: hypothetical protein PHQ65_11395, partial [Bacteroidales bacterium]|nr:hypothetical protein [Bacteroidales bacterium]
MKKSFSLVFILLAVIFTTKGEIVVTLPEVTAVPGTEIFMAVKISGASASGTPFSVADIRFNYDTAALTYTGITNFYSAMPASQWVYAGGAGEVAANWLHPTFQTIAVPDETTLYEVKFTAKPGACDLSFILIEFADAGLNILPSSAEDGTYTSIQNVTFQVDMRDQTVGTNGVHLAGSFNSWNTSALAMTATSGSVYTVTQSFLVGSDITFRHVNGNTTAGYEIVPASCGVPATGGLFDRSLTVPDGDTVLPAFCFSSCDSCPPLIQVDFRLDMAQQTVNPTGVHIAGDFNNWSTTSTALTNLGNNVFGVSIPMIPGSSQQFRYINGNSASGYELVPSTCGVSAGGGLYNRQIMTGTTDTTLSEVCFSSCDDCPNLIELTVLVDMSQATVSPSGVFVAGSFNGFSTTANPMTHMGNNVYSATLEVFENDFVTYRFVNGNTPSGYENVPETCGILNGAGSYNRFIQVAATDTTLDEVCFSSCTDCVSNPG